MKILLSNIIIVILSIIFEYKLIGLIIKKKDLKKIKQNIIFLIYFFVRLYLIYNIQNRNYKLFIIFVLFYLINLLLFEGEFVKRIISIVIVLGNLIFMEILSLYFSEVLALGQYAEVAELLFITILFLGLLHWIDEVLVSSKNSSISKQHKIYFSVTYALVLIFIAASFYCLDEYVNASPQKLSYNFRYAFIFFIFIMIIEFKRCFHKEEEIKTIKNMSIYYENQLEIYKLKNEKIKKIKHDYDNHLATLSFLIRKNYNKEAYKYINDINYLMDVEKEYIETGIFKIDSILNYKIHQAKKLSIEIDYDIKVLKVLKAEAIDITIILGNLLDNAIEALDQVDDNKFLKFRLYTEKGLLFIRVKNKYNGQLRKKNGKIKSIKANSDEHGIGLTNVYDIVNKYNGAIHINTGNKEFQVHIVLSN